MKKICCFICIFCIIITIIPVHANAEIVIDDLIEMYIQWFIDTGSKMLDMTPEAYEPSPTKGGEPSTYPKSARKLKPL